LKILKAKLFKITLKILKAKLFKITLKLSNIFLSPGSVFWWCLLHRMDLWVVRLNPARVFVGW
jgi:uncharacterized membrane protein YqhA